MSRKVGDVYEDIVVKEDGTTEVKQFRVVDVKNEVKENGEIIKAITSELIA